MIARVAGPGRVSDIRVRVGDAWACTDARGLARVRVRAASMITVAIDEATLPRCMSGDAAEIDARRSRRVWVRLRYAFDPCACRDCD